MRLRDVERRAFDILASSILRSMEVSYWLYNGEMVKLPFYTETSPDRVHVFVTEVNVPSTEHTWFLKFLISGNALLKVDNESYAGVDEMHTYVPIHPGKHVLELRVSPRTLFGVHGWKLAFENAYLIEVNTFVFNVGFLVLSILRFIEALPRDDSLRRDLEELLQKSLLTTRLNPSLSQIAMLQVLLYESGYRATRADLPRMHGDYAWLTYTYGTGVLKKHLEDTSYSSRFDATEEAKRIHRLIREELEKLKEKYPKVGLLYIAGHSHIDAAWLWPKNETIEKVLRTFSTITRHAESYDFVYVQSSAQYYEWVEEKDPALFEKIKKLVEQGKWIVAGGMWIESDTNLVEGECLARQFLYGQRYFLEKFGKTSKIGWLPDSFGFSGNLPQIMKKSGIEVFVTHKVMWNDTNEFPYHSFKWRGIDGTIVPVQVLITSYGESLTPDSVYRYWIKYKEKNTVPFTVYAYGYSDGGGGPTREMLELVSLINMLPGLPSLRNIVEDEYVEMIKRYTDKMSVWSGELYPEFHRGTFTTNVAVKNAMVNAEVALITAEAFASAASAVKGVLVDTVEFHKLWKLLLFNQFHDIIPGSSIKEVYDDAIRELEHVANRSQRIIEEVLGGITRRSVGQGTIAVVNPHPWVLSFVAKLPKDAGVPADVECQETEDGYYVVLRAQPLGLTVYNLVSDVCEAKSDGVSVERTSKGIIMENEFVRLMVDENGNIASLVLKHGNIELLREPAKIVVHVDKPGVFDAWEVTSDFLVQGWEMSIAEKPRVVVEGPLVSCVRFSKSFEESLVEQTLCLYKDSPVVEIRSRLKWSSKGVLVKHWFKTTIDAVRAHFDIPFGVIERSTRFETSWEKAMFEAPALRWVDVSDGTKGFAIVAPSRHGYSVIKGDVSLSLIRSPVFPNPWSDIGVFDITYYLYPHEGDYEKAEVPRIARELVFKPVVKLVEGVLEGFSAITVTPPHAMLAAFKYSHSGDAFVLRFYNPYPRDIKVKVKLGFSASRVVETNIVELEETGVLVEHTDEFELHLLPFEVKSLKIEPRFSAVR
ncbi:MAG: glycoside hydrolase family 38 C-terminal domain-containing protein [Desulfurococcaceae archaeon]